MWILDKILRLGFLESQVNLIFIWFKKYTDLYGNFP